jgi:hypothetical protein
MSARVAAAIASAAVGLALVSAAAEAAPSRPVDLRVKGGEDAWHAEDRFTLEWTNPPLSGGPPLAAVHYRIRNPQGTAVGETEIGWVSDGIAAVTVPKTPGAYSAEVWLENAGGEEGPAATAHLRFDDTRPTAIEPPPVPAWIGRAAFPLRVVLGRPTGPAPVSGIRGYAVTIDAAPDRSPCAAPDRCEDAETTLRDGIDHSTLTIAALPAGTSYLQAVAVTGSGMKSATSGGAVLHVDTTDPVTRLDGPSTGWTNRSVTVTANSIDSGAGMDPQTDGPRPFTAIRIDDSTPAIAPGSHVSAAVIGEGVHHIAYYARDAAGNVDDGAGDNGIANDPPRTALVRIDRDAPGVAFSNSQDPRDPELLRVRIADSLSGPDPSRGSIGVRRAGSGDPFQPLPPAPPVGGELRARWDSDAYPKGEYEFQATGYDDAGNATLTRRCRNGTAMVLSNPLKTTTDLSVGFHRRAVARTVPYGRGVLVEGRLAAAGSALGGMPLRIVERFASGVATRVTTTRTGPSGAFSTRLTPGPSRTITASFDGSPTLSRSTGRSLELRVRSWVRLQASSTIARVGGAPLVFRGRIAAAPGTIPTEGKSVQLQFRLPGLPWAEFRTVQTDRAGRFRYAYRFSDDDSRGARFQFRAFVPAEDNWPYEPGGSRPVIVRGI